MLGWSFGMSQLREMWDTTHSFLTIWHREMAVFKIVMIPDTLMTLNLHIVTQQIAHLIQIIEIKGWHGVTVTLDLLHYILSAQ